MYKILTFKTRRYGTGKKETHKYKERKDTELRNDKRALIHTANL